MTKLNNLQVVEIDHDKFAKYLEELYKHWNSDEIREFHKQSTKDLLRTATLKYKFDEKQEK